MRPAETVAALTGFDQRGAGTDSERRAARWLADQIESGARASRLEPFWCRPNWALAHAWHVALALAGSLLAVSSPRIGGALILAALLSVIVDELTGVSPGRRLTFERASQNVVGIARDPGLFWDPSGPADPTEDHDDRAQTHATLIITANYDAGRAGLVYRDRLRAAAAALRKAIGRRGPGWLGWISIALVWLLAIALARLEGSKGSGIGVLQLIPTVGLVLALALLLELGSSDYSPGAGDNGSGTAVAVALAAALDAAPPRNATVELVLQGASDASALGLRRHLRARRTTLNARNTIVIGIGPCSSGRLRWWVSDGPLLPLRYLPRLAELCQSVSDQEPELEADPHRGRGTMPALAARAARLPAIAIGCLDGGGLVPRSHQRSDTAGAVDQLAMDDTVQFGLMLAEAIDSFLATRPASAERPAAATT